MKYFLHYFFYSSQHEYSLKQNISSPPIFESDLKFEKYNLDIRAGLISDYIDEVIDNYAI